MKAVVKSAKAFDERAVELGLDELILMENAGTNLAKIAKNALRKKGVKNGRILILLGQGNNGADGLVAARHLKNARCFCVDKNLKKSPLFEKQEKIALNLGIKFLDKKPNFQSFDCIIECIFGSGLDREVSPNLKALIAEANESRALKIACDMPVNLGFEPCFNAKITATMGAIKENLLEDYAKESVGKIKCVNLGLNSSLYAPNSNCFLLEKGDLELIERKKSANKGDFGHGFICASASAGTLAGLGALNFGAGLISLVGAKPFSPLIMQKERIDESASAVALGMGLDDLSVLNEPLLEKIPVILDANAFKSSQIRPFLQRQNVILTPHPKEFARLWKIAFDENLSSEQIQKNRFFYADKFAQNFECVLILKGANTIIAQKEQKFVCTLGNAALAKGGSGDALAGMILALICAKFSPLNAAKNAVLAHALVAKKWRFNPNAFDALKLIKGLKCL